MEWLVKPAEPLWRARAYLIFAAILWAISALVAPPFEGVTPRYWYYDLVDEAISGTGRIALPVLFAGLAYAVLIGLADYLWASKVQKDLQEGFKGVANTIATGVSGINREAVLAWVTRGLGQQGEYRAVAMAALRQHYGKPAPERDNYLEYVMNNVFDKALPSICITRENFTESVVLRKKSGDELLEWEDDRRYTCVCPEGNAEETIGSIVTSRAEGENVNEIAKRLALTITVDGRRIFSFQDWYKSLGGNIDKIPFEASRDGGKLSFDGRWLSFEYEHKLKLEKTKTAVRITERSFLQQDDRFFCLIINQPTFNTQFDMKLEGLPDWHLRKPIVGASWYHSGSTKFAEIDQNTAQWVSARIPEWVLPGLALIVEWTGGTGNR